MTDDRGSHKILSSILQVLQQIEKKLDGYEERLLRLESAEEEGQWAPEHGNENDGLVVPVQDESIPEDGKSKPKIHYTEWDTNHFIESMSHDVYNEWDAAGTNLDEFFDLKLSNTTQKLLGDCWSMPDDDRLPLKFVKVNILRFRIQWGAHTSKVFTTKKHLERELDRLCQFDQELRSQKGNDFVVVDFDAFNSSRIYRLGQPAIGPDLLVDLKDTQEAPWSRIILYQGATTGGSISPNRDRLDQPIPYFSRRDRLVGVWNHIFNHLQLKCRGTTTNPYATSPWPGFHTTFYEICETTDPVDKELWKNGPLYDHPLGWHFRKCAYTLYCPLSEKQIGMQNRYGEWARFWTILILSPSGFFDDHNRSFPMREIGVGQAQALGHCFGRLTQLGAEMNLIGHGLEKISERWTDFQTYFDYILDSGDSLMQPTEHDNLLFDDGAFSRSRKYFWAIDCLTEFDVSISDNLTQWELYKAARVPIMAEALSKLDQVQLSFADRQYAILQNQRDSFRQKLAATKALRDALFNASAVIESRASTRLGENVKLLTFVSIFFLPLAFTTSLWSVNDKFSFTVLIYVIILVALSTYFTMFNINSLAQGFGHIYDVRKKDIVRAMKRDRKDTWRLRGRRFEVFRPKHDNPEPSEWFIPFYAIIHPSSILGFINREEIKDPKTKNFKSETSVNWLTRLTRSLHGSTPADEEKKPFDEGWVM